MSKRVVYKYEFNMKHTEFEEGKAEAELNLPVGAIIIKMDFLAPESGNLTFSVWALVDPAEITTFKQKLILLFTGTEYELTNDVDTGDEEYLQYVTTLQINGIIIHVFEQQFDYLPF